MCYVPDYLDQWSEHNRQQEEEIKKLPKCDYCGAPIFEDHFYLINDEYVCPECLEEHFKKRTEDYCNG